MIRCNASLSLKARDLSVNFLHKLKFENFNLIVNYIKLCLTTSKYISCTYWYFILSGGCEIN